MSRPLLAALLTAALIGCDAPDPDAVSAHSALLEDLSGAWKVEAILSSSCPTGLERAMPIGETTWSVADGHLTIASATSSTAPVTLTPISDHELAQTTTVSVPGCAGTETLSLTVDALGAHWASGIYTATLAHDGRAACEQLAADADLPGQCRTEVRWQARRL